jgi:hypothetical protein
MFSLRMTNISQWQCIMSHRSVNRSAEGTRAVWKVRGLAAVCCCYAEGGSDCYTKL